MVQSYVSPEVAQPYADLTSRIQQVGARPYTPYGGQRLAATTGDQALARAAYGAYGRGPGPAGTGQAAATMSQAGRMIGGAQQGMGNVASKFGAFAPLAQQQAQAGAEGMRGVGEQAGSPELCRMLPPRAMRRRSKMQSEDSKLTGRHKLLDMVSN